MSAPVNVLAVLRSSLDEFDYMARTGQREITIAYSEAEHERIRQARDAVAKLIEAANDARSLLSEIDKSVRAEHAKNGAPKSQSIAGIVNGRLSAALARAVGAAP